jgi:hypothetical protein
VPGFSKERGVSKVIRVVVPLDPMEEQSWHLAAAYAVKIACEGTPRATDVILLTHTKDQLRHTSLAGHVGINAAKALGSGARLDLEAGATLRHATLRTLGHSARNAVIIAFYAEDRMLEALDGLAGVLGIVAVPDLAGQADGWIERWGPVVHGSPRAAPEKLIDDPVVERALEAITTLSNIAYDVMHTRDKQHADEIFRILRAKGHTLDPTKIKSWAIRRGWKPDGAEELAKVAAKVMKLARKPSLAGFHEPHDRYARWKGGH